MPLSKKKSPLNFLKRFLWVWSGIPFTVSNLNFECLQTSNFFPASALAPKTQLSHHATNFRYLMTHHVVKRRHWAHHAPLVLAPSLLTHVGVQWTRHHKCFPLFLIKTIKLSIKDTWLKWTTSSQHDI